LPIKKSNKLQAKYQIIYSDILQMQNFSFEKPGLIKISEKEFGQAERRKR
jgi:hypothetical protein